MPVDPDEKHKNYFRDNPNGNHDRMSPETRAVVDAVKEKVTEIAQTFKEHTVQDAANFARIRENQTKTHTEIVTTLAVIEQKVDGVHRRQDITNGRIAKAEERTLLNNAEIEKLYSDFNRVYEEFHNYRVMENKKLEKKDERVWDLKKEYGKVVLGIIFAILGALAMAVLQRTNVLDLSIAQTLLIHLA